MATFWTIDLLHRLQKRPRFPTRQTSARFRAGSIYDDECDVGSHFVSRSRVFVASQEELTGDPRRDESTTPNLSHPGQASILRPAPLVPGASPSPLHRFLHSPAHCATAVATADVQTDKRFVVGYRTDIAQASLHRHMPHARYSSWDVFAGMATQFDLKCDHRSYARLEIQR